jgi:hypothetical protein
MMSKSKAGGRGMIYFIYLYLFTQMVATSAGQLLFFSHNRLSWLSFSWLKI